MKYFILNILEKINIFYEQIIEEIKNSTALLLVIVFLIGWIYIKNEQLKNLEYNFETYSQELNTVLDKYPNALKLKKEYDAEYLKDYLNQ